MEVERFRLRGEAGFTLIEVMVGMAILSLIAVMVGAISMSGIIRIKDESRDRQDDATTAQWVSVKFARDVQGAARTAPECAAGSGSRLVTLEASDGSGKVEYRVVSNGSTYELDRVECGAVGTTAKVVGGLEAQPTVSCGLDVDHLGTCTDNSTPRVVSLDVARNASFQFTLDGTRRTTDANESGGPTAAPTFMSLGGDLPLSIAGNGGLTVNGDAIVNAPDSGTQAIKIQGNGDLGVTGEFQVEQGAICDGCDTTPGSLPNKLPDPLRFLPEPDPVALGLQPESCADPVHPGDPYVCQPGVYADAFPPPARANNKVVLQPGTYVLQNGLKVSGNAEVASAGGVLLFNQSGEVSLTGNGKIDLTPPGTGVYAGILYFQSRTNTSTVKISGNSKTVSLEGTIYVPASTGVTLGIGNGGLEVGRVIGTNVVISGNGGVTVGSL